MFMITQIKSSNEFKEILKGEKPIIADFYADWCGPCKMMAPLVAGLAESYSGKCKIGKCNTDENPNLSREFKIMSIPTFLFFKDGKLTPCKIKAIFFNIKK